MLISQGPQGPSMQLVSKVLLFMIHSTFAEFDFLSTTDQAENSDTDLDLYYSWWANTLS